MNDLKICFIFIGEEEIALGHFIRMI